MTVVCRSTDRKQGKGWMGGKDLRKLVTEYVKSLALILTAIQEGTQTSILNCISKLFHKTVVICRLHEVGSRITIGFKKY